MLGSTLFRALSRHPDLDVSGSIRNSENLSFFEPNLRDKLTTNIDLNDDKNILESFISFRPDFVINCIGIVKQLPDANDYLQSLSINALLPHRLAKLCEMIGSKLIHFSTDCVFSGKTGHYQEHDFADANDLYGRTKFLGEVCEKNCLTLRTSIIGHELHTNKSLIDWFLSQSKQVFGFTKAVFSGLPTIEVARVITDYVIPYPSISGMYHLSVDPINKFDLLSLVAEMYGKDIEIIPDERLVIDRSLNSDRFRAYTGFKPKPWYEMVKNMHAESLRTFQI